MDLSEKRFFSESLEKKRITIKGEEFFHIFKVMRCKTGEVIELINGKNIFSLAKIISIGKNSLEVEIIKKEEKPPPFKISLLQAIISPKKMDFIIEKATELGVTNFIFFPSKYSLHRTVSKDRLKRFLSITIAAIKQCDRYDLPSISYKKNLKAVLDTITSKNILFGDIREDSKFIKKVKKDPHIFIGPEKGFSKDEVSLLEKNGAEGIRINKNTLRAETAAISSISILSYLRR